MNHCISWAKRLSVLLMVIMLTLSWLAPAAYALTDEQKFLAEVWRVVDRAYVDDTFNNQNWWLIRQKALKQPLADREQAYTAAQQMLAGLGDPFTRLLKPDQYRSLQTNTSGELTGVGLQIALDKDGKIRVISPIAGSPADHAGIQPADAILGIDGTPTSGLGLDEAAERMRGPAGSRVRLMVERDGSEAMELDVVRDRIALNPVIADLRTQANPAGGPPLSVGYIRLSQFNANATMEVAHAIHRLESQGAEAYVLDLRNNPGGLLQAGIEVARLWLDSGTIVYTVNRQGVLGSFEATGQAITDDPLVVLVNQGTASASEILAGALKDNNRATIVGERTFGKGLIQSLFDLSDGAGIAVTVAKYETPNHNDINRLGIAPDITVALDPISLNQVGTDADNQYRAAVEQLVNYSTVAAGAA
ncbi:PDZ domain-containing protein [Leptolyngbya sp. FACHB-36]|uniref:carboxyl-terminal processing protease CtpA n=1 Tax=Leptolyngbya sp. FACHB-36 TaxID=2692808 RepID=UPI0016809571|nr:carboxyl-terminal processing protease CtpA [Leptolyngbya sp. FACHB-36]MBD2020040.1 PDZ domain-containing protein [Leptolyngbya sp. FACHB-36]